MRYLALALDYDGTAASDGKLSDAASSAIERLRTSGRRVVLVTGRRVGDLLQVLPRSTLFDLIVAENGAVIYDPQSREEIPLAAPLPARFAERLRERGVAPLEEGAVVVATHDPHGGVMLEVIRELGLEIHVIFNRGAVMALPPGINKATGLDVAVRRFGMSRHEVVGIGDGENDHSLLEYCECGVASRMQSIRSRISPHSLRAEPTALAFPSWSMSSSKTTLSAWKGSWSVIWC